jgi:L-2-hydroxyglutarate oxidase LhgO
VDGNVSDRIAIIGGGIVGVATARAFAARGADVTVIEKEHRLAAHQTGHNSGVVHAGIYYAPGSLKAILCARGRELLKDFCADKHLPYIERGKLVVAVDDSEIGALNELERRSRENQVLDLQRLGGAELHAVEPHVRGVAALLSPRTAVVDYASVTEALAQDVREQGGRILLGSEVTGLRIDGDGVIVTTPVSEERFDRVVACAGLQSDLVAQMMGAPLSPRILPFRGEYWTMKADRSHLVNGMIYPVPDPRFPFLGVHFTRGVYGEVHVGPSAVPALAREGYSWLKISAKDTWGSLSWPGARSLFKEHWRMGIKEVSGSLFKPYYFQQARRFMPELRMSDLEVKSEAGVRAQAWGDDGKLLDDFAIDQVGPVTLLRNAPSPAATSAIAIAEHLLEQLEVSR